MVQFVKINNKEYPFYFGFRELFRFSQKNSVEFSDIQGKVSVDFDALLELFALASKKGAKRNDTPELVLTAEEIETAVDEDAALFTALQNAFTESQVFKSMSAGDEDEGK